MMRRLLAVPILVATLTVAGCAIPIDQNSNPLNPLKGVVTIVPWARAVDDAASAQELQSRIEELIATLPTLDLPQSTQDRVEGELSSLSAAVRSNPQASSANAAKLRSIINEIKAASDGSR